MNPLLKRILVHGGLTAFVLGLVGVLFAELANLWSAGFAAKPGSAELNPALPDDLRYRVPLTLAGLGFAFVAASELIVHRFRRKKPAGKLDQPPIDDAEKLLNELLEQAESRMATERRAEGGEQKSGEPPA